MLKVVPGDVCGKDVRDEDFPLFPWQLFGPAPGPDGSDARTRLSIDERSRVARVVQEFEHAIMRHGGPDDLADLRPLRNPSGPADAVRREVLHDLIGGLG